MSSEAFRRFEQSMAIDYEKWHDGVGYDLDALSQLDDREKLRAEALLAPRAEKDWRDLEALDRLGTAGAKASIDRARNSRDPEVRLYAHTYGSAPSEKQMEAAIVYALESAEPFAGLVLAMRCATEHPTPGVLEALWKKVRQRSKISYHAAEALCTIAGVIEGEWDWTHRPLFLRLMEAESEDRKAAVAELEKLVSR